jgi:hypothetical protein
MNADTRHTMRETRFFGKNLVSMVAALVASAVLIASCAGAPVEEVREVTQAEMQEEEPAEVFVEAPAPTPAPTPSPATDPDESRAGGYSLTTLPNRPNRLIVKNAELKLLVADTDVTIDRVTQVAADCAGYIISSRIWYEQQQEESYKYATVTLGVPVDQFERAMRRLRNLAVRVVDETASGQDVTDEYVDLQSRLDNLKATRDRIRQFLDQAQSVEESLRVNEQLAAIEEQIEQVQGRMNYLFDRAAYSTITIQIDPELPPVTPMPTPTPTPTPTPAPPWSPSQTVQQAGHTLGSILRVLTELGIWVAIVVVPLLGPPALIIWAIQRRARRHARRQTP